MGQASGVFSVVDEQLLAERATESCEDSNMSNVVWAMEKVSVAAVIIQVTPILLPSLCAHEDVDGG